MPQPEWVAGRLKPEPFLSRFIYGTFLKRSSSYMTTVMGVALVAGIGYEYIMNGIWNVNNKGKLWKDIKNNYQEDE